MGKVQHRHLDIGQIWWSCWCENAKPHISTKDHWWVKHQRPKNGSKMTKILFSLFLFHCKQIIVCINKMLCVSLLNNQRSGDRLSVKLSALISRNTKRQHCLHLVYFTMNPFITAFNNTFELRPTSTHLNGYFHKRWQISQSLNSGFWSLWARFIPN